MEKGGFPQSRPAIEVTAARTSGIDDLVFSRQTGFSSANIRLLISRKAQNNGQQVAGHDDRPNIF